MTKKEVLEERRNNIQKEAWLKDYEASVHEIVHMAAVKRSELVGKPEFVIVQGPNGAPQKISQRQLIENSIRLKTKERDEALLELRFMDEYIKNLPNEE
jgi:hypothetical protein